MKPQTQVQTQLNDSMSRIEKRFFSECKQITDWFSQQWQLTPPPVYGSVDLRNAGFKIAPIDMNLFPAGFNNLNPDFLPLAITAAQTTIKNRLPHAKKIIILPESHTRNLNYWQNIKTLHTILITAGFQVRIGFLDPTLTITSSIELSNNERVQIEPIQKKGPKLNIGDFEPDLILLNNDLSAGIPDILQQVQQPIWPPAQLGWHQRLKSEHFQFYKQVAQEFSAFMAMDPWLISPLFGHCGEINFMQQAGLDCLIDHAEILLQQIRVKYAEYQIQHEPFLIVKADAGTYGMAVMTVRSVDELKNMNRKQRTRMSMTKGRQAVTQVIIQEGIYTFETIGVTGAVAEPVVYVLGDTVIGGFYRVHQDRGVDENLNAPGMRFEPLAFPQPCTKPSSHTYQPDSCRYFTYGVIAQLSMLAAAREIKAQIA